MSSLGNLTVLTGPSGVGKGTIVRKILESHKDVWLSISATTRHPRSGEIEGEHYFFLEKERGHTTPVQQCVGSAESQDTCKENAPVELCPRVLTRKAAGKRVE